MEQESTEQNNNAERINFIIAVCAILISIASFYATYLQANSAEQQVKAMTYPLIQYSSSNYDEATKHSEISLNLRNSGVGPAIIKQVEYKYNNQNFTNIWKFLRACCDKEIKEFEAHKNANKVPVDAQIISSPSSSVVLPINDHIRIVSLRKHESNAALWNKLNYERFLLKVSVCYCSLLDNCYVTEKAGQITEVEFCPQSSNKDD